MMDIQLRENASCKITTVGDRDDHRNVDKNLSPLIQDKRNPCGTGKRREVIPL